MAKQDGGTKVIHTVKDTEVAQATVDALNASTFGAAAAVGFKFVVLAKPDDTLAITATGPWHLPGNQRPAHGTMQTWAMGYAQCYTDLLAANALRMPGFSS